VAVGIRERVAWREIDVVVHSRELVSRNELASDWVSPEAAAGPGKGVGRGVAGSANAPFAAMGLLLSAGFPEAALLSAAGAVFVVSSPAPLLFCCAHSGKAKNTLIASAGTPIAHLFSPQLFSRIPFDSAPVC